MDSEERYRRLLQKAVENLDRHGVRLQTPRKFLILPYKFSPHQDAPRAHYVYPVDRIDVFNVENPEVRKALKERTEEAGGIEVTLPPDPEERDQNVQIDMEHELLHKWQYDDNRELPRNFRKRAAKLENTYRKAVKYYQKRENELDHRFPRPPNLLPPTPSFGKKEERKRAALLLASGNEVRECLDKMFDRILRLEEEYSGVSPENQAAIRDMRKEMEKIHEEAVDDLVNISRSHKSEVREVLRPIEERKKKISEEHKETVEEWGEAMSQFWSIYRNILPQPGESGEKLVKQYAASKTIGYIMNRGNLLEAINEGVRRFHEELDIESWKEARDDKNWNEQKEIEKRAAIPVLDWYKEKFSRFHHY